MLPVSWFCSIIQAFTQCFWPQLSFQHFFLSKVSRNFRTWWSAVSSAASSRHDPLTVRNGCFLSFILNLNTSAVPTASDLLVSFSSADDRKSESACREDRQLPCVCQIWSLGLILQLKYSSNKMYNVNMFQHTSKCFQVDFLLHLQLRIERKLRRNTQNHLYLINTFFFLVKMVRQYNPWGKTSALKKKKSQKIHKNRAEKQFINWI